MVGGKSEVYDRCREIFQSFGDGIFYVGEHGTGHLVKALNNLLSATTLASAAEAARGTERRGCAGQVPGDHQRGQWAELLHRVSFPATYSTALSTMGSP